MIQLLFLVLFAEGAVALILIWKIGPLRELAMKGLDQLKIGKGPATMKTLACTMSVIFVSSITSILKIQNRGTKLGTVTPMDQVLWRTHLIEASLIGNSNYKYITFFRCSPCCHILKNFWVWISYTLDLPDRRTSRLITPNTWIIKIYRPMFL